MCNIQLKQQGIKPVCDERKKKDSGPADRARQHGTAVAFRPDRAGAPLFFFTFNFYSAFKKNLAEMPGKSPYIGNHLNFRKQNTSF